MKELTREIGQLDLNCEMLVTDNAMDVQFLQQNKPAILGSFHWKRCKQSTTVIKSRFANGYEWETHRYTFYSLFN